MKKICYIFLILAFLISCIEKREKKEKELTPKTTELKTRFLNLNIESNENLKDWFDYYKSIELTFSLDNFILERIDTLNFIQGNIFGSFDENFDKVYSDFIVFSPNKKQYIDFDSYQWALDENKKPMFSPDQEINVVDIDNQSVERIGFYGPSYWVENAFWKNDSTIVLLENSDEKYLSINEINLNSKQIKVFKYQDRLIVQSEYSKLRFKKKGLEYK